MPVEKKQPTGRTVLVLITMVLGLLVGGATTASATDIKDLRVLTAANTLSFGSMTTFLGEQRKPAAQRDQRFDWSSDGCSTPPGLSSWNRTFANPCLRHDFSYRNFGFGGVVAITTETQRKKIDDKFLQDMNAVCATKSVLQRAQCRFVASSYYNVVRVAGGPAYYS